MRTTAGLYPAPDVVVAPFEPILNENLSGLTRPLFAGDYEVIGPDPTLGQDMVQALGTDLVLLHYHHRHEFPGGLPKGLWGNVERTAGGFVWDELDRLVDSACRRFPLVGLYPVGWAHMVPGHLGRSILEVPPPVIAEWVARVVARYWDRVAVFPVFYEMNVFDLFYRATDATGYGLAERRHVVEALAQTVEAVRALAGPRAVSRLTPGTFVELTRSAFYWMSEGALLELPRGSALLEAPLSPPDLLRVAALLDAEQGGQRHEQAIRQMLHQVIFWNADDSGARNDVGADLRRLVAHDWLFDRNHNPGGFAHLILPGWDAQPQNTYAYLSERIAPERHVPSLESCLHQQYTALQHFLADRAVPRAFRDRVIGFVLDDVFKCAKQTGITSAVYPEEHARSRGPRLCTGTVAVSGLGRAWTELARRRQREQA